MVTVIASGETLTVNAGETVSAAPTVENAGTVSNAGTVETFGIKLIATAADIDAGTATATRVRGLVGTAADIDAATAVADRNRDLISTAADIDASTAAADRVRDLVGSATDVDAGTATPTLIRTLTATAADTDEAAARAIILVDASGVAGAIGVIERILSETQASQYAGVKPTVKRWWDDAQSERGPGAGQPPILYVWSPTGSTLDRFSIDSARFDRTETVEVQAWTLDAEETRQLQSDVVDILSQYLDNNERQTPFTDVRPTNTDDFREQKPARTTDHYVMSVEIETRDLQETEKNV